MNALTFQRFGEWDAPMFDDDIVIEIDVPVDRICQFCCEHFAAGDNGAIFPHNLAQHRECGLRGAQGGIGHLVDHARYCHGELGTDAGLSYRQSALLVWRWWVTGVPVTENELEEARRAG